MPDAVIAGGVLYRIGTDHLGSVRVVVKQSDGTVVQRTEFDAWGELVGAEFVGTGWERVPFGFAGGLRDLDTGLVQMGARWYSPEVGRFITKDPIRFDGGYNLYAYANNDPVNFIDPEGNTPTLPFPPVWDWPSWLKWLFPPLATPAGICGGAGMLTAADQPIPDESGVFEKCTLSPQASYPVGPPPHSFQCVYVCRGGRHVLGPTVSNPLACPSTWRWRHWSN